ncbi:type II toxin-antitoxin system HicA family toxin [Agromyces mediolanus]|uniref:type II toxin-antitoxin system HicA family toxin n=1 Tax=Agromyces mediolanus TaxID=41986 RepID=UPI0034D3B836
MLDGMPTYPSMKASKLFTLLGRELGYQEVRRQGSHRTLEATGRPTLTFAFHQGVEIPPGLVRKILTKDAQLTDEEAAALLGLRS